MDPPPGAIICILLYNSWLCLSYLALLWWSWGLECRLYEPESYFIKQQTWRRCGGFCSDQSVRSGSRSLVLKDQMETCDKRQIRWPWQWHVSPSVCCLEVLTFSEKLLILRFPRIHISSLSSPYQMLHDNPLHYPHTIFGFCIWPTSVIPDVFLFFIVCLLSSAPFLEHPPIRSPPSWLKFLLDYYFV